MKSGDSNNWPARKKAAVMIKKEVKREVKRRARRRNEAGLVLKFEKFFYFL